MRFRKYTVLFGLFILCLAFNAWVYASLASEPDVGPALESSARAHAPLLHAYIAIGRPVVAQAGAAVGQSVANAAYGDAYPSMTASPAMADSLLFEQSHGPLSALLVVLYWATPVLLVLALAAWALRSRQTHLMGRVRR